MHDHYELPLLLSRAPSQKSNVFALHASKYDHTNNKMYASERVTITLPGTVLQEIDRLEKNRSRFVLEAVQRELQRRRRADLRTSLENPHPESAQLADAGLEEWGARLPADEASDLVDLRAGKAVRWIPGQGWVETDK